MSDYKKTLCLPRTKFPMRAGLAQNEPKTLKNWQKIDVASVMYEASEPGKKNEFVLHDGPPYANGNIHMGHALNKILKDIIVKSRALNGKRARYVPGWDCHGLPIEHKVSQDLAAKGKVLPPLTVRKICRDYAMKWLKTQREEFKRLGVVGEWDAPYMTMDPVYESATATELGTFMEKGSVVRRKMPVYWCNSCVTALAEAEVEYADHESPSIYVAFPLPDARLAEVFPDANPERAHIVIWTTTPWTLPANQAVAVHPDFDYSLLAVGDAQYIVATDMVEQLTETFGWQDVRELDRVPGHRMEELKASHPFYDRISRVVTADYVTLEAGTGCVHTAPGHGRDDYETGLRFGLEVLSPLNDTGEFLPTLERFGGMHISDANPAIIEVLEESGLLLKKRDIGHSYPHCWRCKKPVIFRATTQWFVSMEKNDLRTRALNAISNDVQWVPAWGRERIFSMIENRPDWCISRQRTWGVPIMALVCNDCGEAWFDGAWAKDIAAKFADHKTGCDWWFEADVADVTPEGLTCGECGGASWQKEDDILDVWFDSGTSFAAVLEKRKECRFPADLYLEGTDQHRGWFHSSMLASMGTRGIAPYKAVLTHGYVLDGEGRKMSKSVGNVVAPQEIIEKYGADILRLWVCAVNYQEDVRISDEIIERLVDAYRRIRNTARFLLGNLEGFTWDEALPEDELLPVDRYSLELFRRRHEQIKQCFDDYEFYKVYQLLHKTCVTDLSAFYLDVIKDRLYVSEATGHERRSARTVLAHVLFDLLLDMAPVLTFTAEEIFGYLPEGLKPDLPSVLALRERERPAPMDTAAFDEFATLVELRGVVSRAAEPLRKAGEIGHSLDLSVTLHLGDVLREAYDRARPDLRELFIASEVRVSDEPAPASAYADPEVPGVAVVVGKARGDKCPRCWVRSEELGTNEAHPEVCPRCAGVLATCE